MNLRGIYRGRGSYGSNATAERNTESITRLGFRAGVRFNTGDGCGATDDDIDTRTTTAAIIIVITLVTLGVLAKPTNQNNMYHIVHSEEAENVFREGCKNLDPLAFTDKGVIHSYVIDDASIRHNPMGGINVAFYINGDEDLYASITLNPRNGDGPLEGGGGSYWAKLDDLIIANNKTYGVNPSSDPDDVAMNYAENLQDPDSPREEHTRDEADRNGTKDV